MRNSSKKMNSIDRVMTSTEMLISNSLSCTESTEFIEMKVSNMSPVPLMIHESAVAIIRGIISLFTDSRAATIHGTGYNRAIPTYKAPKSSLLGRINVHSCMKLAIKARRTHGMTMYFEYKYFEMNGLNEYSVLFLDSKVHFHTASSDVCSDCSSLGISLHCTCLVGIPLLSIIHLSPFLSTHCVPISEVY